MIDYEHINLNWNYYVFVVDRDEEHDCKNEKLLSVYRREKGGVVRYFVNSSENGDKKLTKEIFAEAIEALLKVKPQMVDEILWASPDSYYEVAEKVYKKVMDEYYNLAIADVAFNREISLDKGKKYTLFNEE